MIGKQKVWYTRKEMIERGYPKTQVDKMLHSEYAERFTMRSGTAQNSKFLIDPVLYEKYRRALK